MKFKIFGQKEKTKQLYLKFEQESDGVAIVACDEKGRARRAGYLLKLRNDGTLEKFYAVNNSFGFQLNDKGAIKNR